MMLKTVSPSDRNLKSQGDNQDPWGRIHSGRWVRGPQEVGGGQTKVADLLNEECLSAFQTSMPIGPSGNQSSGGGHQPGHVGSSSGQPGGLGHGGGSLAVAIVHDIPLHAHLMPPLTHHPGHLSNHHQVVTTSLSSTRKLLSLAHQPYC